MGSGLTRALPFGRRYSNPAWKCRLAGNHRLKTLAWNRILIGAAMLQSGLLGPLVDGADFISQFEGRTGGHEAEQHSGFRCHAAGKMQVTALFRAWREPKREVEAPFITGW